MPTSMTGFGRGSASGKQRRYVAEARSVNSRYCEVKINAPKEFLELEHLLSLTVRETFARGKFELILKSERLRPKKRPIDTKFLKARWKELDAIRKELRLKEPVSLEAVLGQLPVGNGADEIDATAKTLFVKAAKNALVELRKFRVREGKNLSKDILARTKKLEQAVRRISGAEKTTQKSRMQKLQERVSELLDGGTIEPRRLEVELAILVDRADISEEIVRLGSHVGRLKKLALAERSVGRELDFLLQEMNREINTIGSKANDLGILDEVILAKAQIEKIREQGQNLE